MATKTDNNNKYMYEQDAEPWHNPTFDSATQWFQWQDKRPSIRI